MRTLILVLVVPLFGASCAGGPDPVPTESASSHRSDPILGTVQFVDVEGGCWKIAGDDGQSYEPLNLPPEYRKDGLRVSFEASLPAEGMGSVCMVGTIVHLDHIEPLPAKDR